MKTVAVLAVQGAFIEHERMLKRLGCACIELRQAADLEKHFDALVLPGGESTAQAKMLRELDMVEDLHNRITQGMPVLGTCAGLILLAENVEEAGRSCKPPTKECAHLRQNRVDKACHSRESRTDKHGPSEENPIAAEGSFSTPTVPQRGADATPASPQHGINGAATHAAHGVFGTLPVTVVRNAYGRQLGSFHTTAPCMGISECHARPNIPMTFIRAPYIKEVLGSAQILARVDERIVAVRHGNQIGVAFHPELNDDPRIHELLISMI